MSRAARPCRLLLLPMVALVLLGLAWPAVAQSMDYGALEALFGEPVTTSATGSPQRPSDVPANMEIITAAMIRRSGATNIPDVLAHVVGVDVLRWGVSSADVAIRGYDMPSSPRLLVLVNGRQVYLDDWGRTQWDALPVQLAEIRQIEIVKGPNTALFGFNAAAGVINIITYNPLYDSVQAASIAGGSQGFVQGSAVGTARLGALGGIRLSAGAWRSDEFAGLQAARPRQSSAPSRQGAVAADMQLSIDADQEIELELTHVALDHLETVATWAAVASDYQTSSIKARYSVATGAGVVQLLAYTNLLDESGQFGGGLIGRADIGWHNRKTVVQLQDVFKPGLDHTVRISAEYQHSAINTGPLAGGTIGYDIAAAGAMWQWQLLPRLALTEALRVDTLWLHRFGVLPAGLPYANDYWDRRIAQPSFNVGLVYRATESDIVRLTVARGAQLPSLLEFGGLQFVVPGLVYVGAPTVAPTVVTNYELDWDHRLPAWQGGTRFALFYQTSHDLQALTTRDMVRLPGGRLLGTAANAGDSQELGLELSARGALPGGWRWNLGYSPRLVQDRYLPGVSSRFSGIAFAETTPRHVIDAGFGWSGGRWEIDAAARFVSRFNGLVVQPDATFVQTRIDDYLTLDARVAYRVTPQLTLSLVGLGISRRTQQQTALGSVERRVFAALQARF